MARWAAGYGGGVDISKGAQRRTATVPRALWFQRSLRFHFLCVLAVHKQHKCNILSHAYATTKSVFSRRVEFYCMCVKKSCVLGKSCGRSGSQIACVFSNDLCRGSAILGLRIL